MIDPDALTSYAPLFVALLVGVPIIAALHRWRKPGLSMREQVARDNARLLQEAGLVYGAPVVEHRSEAVRAR